jgi:hypothetical protein
MRLVKAKKRRMFLARITVASFLAVDAVIKRTMMEAYKQWFCRVASSRSIPSCLPHRSRGGAKVSSGISAETFPVLFQIERTKGYFPAFRRVPRRFVASMNSSIKDLNQELS